MHKNVGHYGIMYFAVKLLLYINSTSFSCNRFF